MSEIPDLSHEANLEILREQCLDASWKRFAVDVARLDSDKGKAIQRELVGNLPITQKLLKDWEHKLSKSAEQYAAGQQERLPGFSATEARVALMTGNGMYLRIADTLGERAELPEPYIKVMEAFRATMPWNRTGSNAYTFKDVSEDDLQNALEYMKNK